MRRNDVVFVKDLEGHAVPLSPWPQTFYVSRVMYETDTVEVRPLTVTGLVKGVGRNLVTMSYWRFLRLLLILGFLPTPEFARFSWRTFTLRFWRHQQWWRLKIVKFAKKLLK